MTAHPDAAHLVLLALAGLLGGIGITAIGPGGVLPTIGLFLLTGLSPSGVAGTAIVTHVATGVLGTAAYTHSGQLKAAATRRCAAVLALAALAGTPLGVLCNTLVAGRGFGLLLALAVTVTGVLVWVRDRRAPHVPDDLVSPGIPPSARRWSVSSCHWRRACSGSAARCSPYPCSSSADCRCWRRWPRLRRSRS